VGYNISRAVGPALAGLIITGFGIAAPFWLEGFGNLVLIAALLWWRSPRKPAERPPAERLAGAARAGLRFAVNSRNLRAILIRAVAFFPFACASWALLPLVARTQMTQGPECYGTLLSMVGAGAIGGSFALSWLKARLGSDGLVAFASLTARSAHSIGARARAHSRSVRKSRHGSSVDACRREPLCGGPDRLAGPGARARTRNILDRFFRSDHGRKRGVGHVAGMEGLPVAHFLAAAGAVVAIPLTWRWNSRRPSNEAPSAIRWNEGRVTHKIAKYGKVDGASSIAALARRSMTRSPAIRRSGT
jgi:hypothetical protein